MLLKVVSFVFDNDVKELGCQTLNIDGKVNQSDIVCNINIKLWLLRHANHDKFEGWVVLVILPLEIH
jgi:hypothetical protein